MYAKILEVIDQIICFGRHVIKKQPEATSSEVIRLHSDSSLKSEEVNMYAKILEVIDQIICTLYLEST